MESLDQEIRDFVRENFLFGDESETLEDDTSFLEQGFIDSTGVLELVTFLEQRFGIEIADDELVPENLESIRRVVAFVESKLQEAEV
ncbi:MAG TPA: acyl carrier protein [Planctomycetaceae bacterium]|nr:acyl carrier protein [Planctomycetaceae bacterium]